MRLKNSQKIVLVFGALFWTLLLYVAPHSRVISKINKSNKSTMENDDAIYHTRDVENMTRSMKNMFVLIRAWRTAEITSINHLIKETEHDHERASDYLIMAHEIMDIAKKHLADNEYRKQQYSLMCGIQLPVGSKNVLNIHLILQSFPYIFADPCQALEPEKRNILKQGYALFQLAEKMLNNAQLSADIGTHLRSVLSLKSRIFTFMFAVSNIFKLLQQKIQLQKCQSWKENMIQLHFDEQQFYSKMDYDWNFENAISHLELYIENWCEYRYLKEDMTYQEYLSAKIPVQPSKEFCTRRKILKGYIFQEKTKKMSHQSANLALKESIDLSSLIYSTI